ncbi:actin-3-like [Anopheles nili]|uniref:actin-3-like n=1 Tax=Anopheles nili TaxID=185578 RepID=UPI00237A8146|nr:actin-3-like [Anopheles nili]
MSQEGVPAVVIDNGSHTIKAGLAVDEDPSNVFRSTVHLFESAEGVTKKFGCLKPSTNGKPVFPIVRGNSYDWDALEAVWEYTLLDVLKIAPEEHSVLLTERPLNGRANREKAIQVMFEKLSTPATYLSMQALLALYAAGRTSGTVVDVGDGLTSVVPIYKNTPVKEAIVNVALAGCDMVDYLAGVLKTNDHEIAREVFEKVCEVSASPTKETVAPVEFKTTNGTSVSLGAERFRCAEAMFEPAAIGHQQGRALPELIVETVTSCNEPARKDLYANIVLAGGSTMVCGFPERLEKELSSRVPAPSRCKVVAPQNRTWSVWTGGCLLASSSAFDQLWITKAEYEEVGVDIVHRKCV